MYEVEGKTLLTSLSKVTASFKKGYTLIKSITWFAKITIMMAGGGIFLMKLQIKPVPSSHILTILLDNCSVQHSRCVKPKALLHSYALMSISSVLKTDQHMSIS